MNPSRIRWLPAPVICFFVIMLPLCGAAVSGRDLGHLLRFPPDPNIPVGYLRFSWWAAGAVMILLGAIAASWIHARSNTSAEAESPGAQKRAVGRLPWWGWAAAGWTFVWWILGWTRFPWFECAQRFTYFPLWMGFIVTVNALVLRRTGTCLMTAALTRWAALFGVSALFWWVFEWLNRLVRNWHYLGVEDFDALSYGVHASVCFSTVLPAVAAVAELLRSYEKWIRVTAHGPSWRWLQRRGTGLTMFAGGICALGLTGVFPAVVYPTLWIAPVALVLGASNFSRRAGLTGEIARGDWTRAATWMTAALICGVFWELWNWHSAAKWIYTVPGVDRWHVFEMPLLGYAGYLPFGLECLFVAERVLGEDLNSPATETHT